jgi:7-carboxy-7-deazaguanine synthase
MKNHKPIQIIPANTKYDKPPPKGSLFLNVSEFFTDSIQGEGINTGCPATFLRLQYCTLNCSWCDTTSVWRHGNPYSFNELFELMERYDVIKKLKIGQHLVITGGSPLRQQLELIKFLMELTARYDILPTIEIENECVTLPRPELTVYVDTWNNSPKLCNSGNPWQRRFRPQVLKFLSGLENSWFKFVITNEKDWEEIDTDFLKLQLIRRNQIILMPEGDSRKNLASNREMVVGLAIRENVRYCTREHIVIWNKAVGV